MLHPRARTMLILSVPAILIGIACSLILIVAMKVAALLQRVLWSNLPAQLGVSADSPLWIIAMLTADRKSTRLNSSHIQKSRMPSSA